MFPDVILVPLDKKFRAGSFERGPGVSLEPKKGAREFRKAQCAKDAFWGASRK